jgi:hypothetical protein
MMSECPSMWIYWKDKRGIREALEYDYPELLKNNPELQQALAMIKNGKDSSTKLRSNRKYL